LESSTSFLHDDAPVPPGFRSLSLPQHHATTIVFPDTRSLLAADEFSEDGYYYALSHTPTTLRLAAKIAAIEGGTNAVLTSSGMAAIALTYLATVRPGDHVLLPQNAYRPNRDFARIMLTELGVTVLEYAPDEVDLGERLSERLRLLWIEAPGSITLETPNVKGLIEQAHSVGAKAAVDNTWSSGVYFQPLMLGADYSIQALSKYQSGASDVFMGAVVTRCADDHARLKETSIRLGYSVSADDCFLVYRSLGSLWARLAAHEAAALQIAQMLAEHPRVQHVLHPALPSCGGHDNWKSMFTGSSGVFSFTLDWRYTFDDVCAVIDALRYFKIGFSWGGSTSLATPYPSPVWWPERDRCSGIIRLGIGLERPGDLQDDLTQALERLR